MGFDLPEYKNIQLRGYQQSPLSLQDACQHILCVPLMMTFLNDHEHLLNALLTNLNPYPQAFCLLQTIISHVQHQSLIGKKFEGF